MPWSWDVINREWLGGDTLAVAPADVVEAFNRVEAFFGPAWLQAQHRGVGALLTLPLVRLGEIIGSLAGVTGAEKLLDRLRQNEEAASAYSEATAIHLIRNGRPSTAVELYPTARIGDALKQPDFRVRDGDPDWIYVEVARPDASEEQQQVIAVLQRLAGIVFGIRKSFGLEVFLRRQPSAAEVEFLAQRIPVFCSLEADQCEALPDDLGLLLLSKTNPGMIVPHQHPGEPICPRLGCARAIGGGNEPHRHIAVRIAYADTRAKRFLSDEARQLPKEHPGLIMLDMTQAVSGLGAWEPLLRRCFQPTQRTRVSGICLFSGGQVPTDSGLAWLQSKKLLVNPHARFPLPAWLAERLEARPSARPH